MEWTKENVIQKMEELRDKGFIDFLDRGIYKKIVK